MYSTPKFQKTLADGSKTTKIMYVFSFEIFPLYGMLCVAVEHDIVHFLIQVSDEHVNKYTQVL